MQWESKTKSDKPSRRAHTEPDELDTTLQQMSRLRDTLGGDFAGKVKTLNEITSVLVSDRVTKDDNNSD